MAVFMTQPCMGSGGFFVSTDRLESEIKKNLAGLGYEL